MAILPEPRDLDGGRYQLLRRLAVGGMGEVVLAKQCGAAGFSRLVVIKRLLPQLLERPELVSLFIDEARIAAHLSHANIVQIHDFGESDDSFYLAMEYVPGANLARLVQRATERQAAFPRELAVYVVCEVLCALEHAHEACDAESKPLNIVHRDVSPQNVLVSRTGRVKLTDFGVARASNRFSHTATGEFRGKLAYAAPEQLAGKTVDRRADLFAVGILLWELTLLRRLFAAAAAAEVLKRVLKREIPRPTEIDPSYPPGLEAIVMSALEIEPDRRPSTATQLLASLRRSVAEVDGADRGAAHRDALRQLVSELFPEGPEEIEAAGGDHALSGAATVRLPDTARHGVQAGEGLVARPPGGDASLATAAMPTVGRPKPPAGQPKRRELAVAGVTGALLLATTVMLWYVAGADHPPAQVARPPDAASRPPAARLAAAPDRPDAALGPDGGALHARPAAPVRRAHRRKKHAARPAAPFTAQPASPAPAPSAPPTGTLAVASEPWGSVTIDGRDHGQTDLQVSLPAGQHRVQVAVSQGGNTVAAAAEVAAGRKTKCRVSKGRMRCEPPR